MTPGTIDQYREQQRAEQELWICRALSVCGWAMIALSVVYVFLAGSGLGTTGDYTVSWVPAIAVIFGGILLVALAAIVRLLYRIECALRSTPVPQRTLEGSHIS